MKRMITLKLAMSLCLFLFVGMNMSAQTVVFSENFDKFTAGTTGSGANSTDIATRLDDFTQLPGWTGEKVYQAGGTAKMGTSSVIGWLETPAIDLSGNDGKFTVSFKSMAWSGDSDSLNIYLNGVLVYELKGLPNTASYSLNTFSVNLTGGTSASKIKFEGRKASKGRFFLEDLVISSGGQSLSVDATLSDLKVDGVTLADFSASKTDYVYRIAMDVTEVPVVTATANDSKAQVTITPSVGLPGTTNILVTAEDPSSTKDYTVEFYRTDNDGTKEKPFTIQEAQVFQGSGYFWIEGVILGCVNTQTGDIINDPIAFANSNLALAQIIKVPLVTGYSDDTLHVSVQLPAGTVRNALNLMDNPTNLNKKVKLYGSLETYCTIDGIKSVSDYVLEGGSAIDLNTLSEVRVFADGQYLHVNELGSAVYVHVYDVSGRIAVSQFIHTENATLPLSRKGIYFVKIVSQGSSKAYKVINR